MKFPVILSLLTLIGGVFISILFGANEALFKNKIANDLKKNVKIMSIQDETERNKKIEAEKSKNWRYYQRFHFHSTGIGAMSLGALFLLFISHSPLRLKKISAYMISIGGFLYPYVWLLAALYGPIIGRGEAKENAAFFGYMGGVFLLGLFLLLFLLLKYPIKSFQNE